MLTDFFGGSAVHVCVWGGYIIWRSNKYMILCMRHLVSEADVIPPLHFTDPSRFQQALMVKAVWDTKVMTVSERENTNIYSVWFWLMLC